LCCLGFAVLLNEAHGSTSADAVSSRLLCPARS
jgi:hypothetical protein